MMPDEEKRPQSYPMPRKQGFDRGYIISVPGILTVIAMICAFAGMISIEVVKGLLGLGSFSGSLAFHEFNLMASWITLLLFTGIATMQLYRKVPILTGSVMKLIMLGHSATFAILTFISSAIILDSVGSYSAIAYVSALRASGAFGLLECCSLLVVSLFLMLDFLNIKQTLLFE